MKVYTIGFTKKKAEVFFKLIKSNDVKRIIDVRLNNVSQLAGFAKKEDLIFFLNEICQTDYQHIPDLAPTKEMLDAYKKKTISWEVYEDKFINLIAKRNIEKTMDKEIFKDGCLLCSEHEPDHCHRRVVVDYLNKCWNGNLQVKHLL
jgi:uncharacterized protein (DUF488 family)